MANKNRNLIVAYFPSVEAADAAAQQLKHWDQDAQELKLGGMGIITLEDGELKVHKVGARAAGTGAKWGAVLGATGGLAVGGLVAAAAMTGGLALLPAAGYALLAGLETGAVGGLLGAGVGELFHKRIGMTDADRSRIHDHLARGGAALAVMADDDEVEPTKAEIAALGGDVEHYAIPEHVMDEVDETREAVAEAHEQVAEHLADQPIDVQDKAAVLVAAVPALGAAGVAALHKIGIYDVDQFLAKAATENGRAELAAATGQDVSAVERWMDDLNFARIRGVGPKYAALLRAAGVESVEDLAKANAEDLAKRLADVNASQHIVKDLPSAEHVGFWIAQANELPPALAHVAIKVHRDMLNVSAYAWQAAAPDDPHKVKMDAVMFNRKEGYEVIPMIQKVCDTFGFQTVDDVKRVEAVIANELPGNVRSRENVYNWLVRYFETHWTA